MANSLEQNVKTVLADLVWSSITNKTQIDVLTEQLAEAQKSLEVKPPDAPAIDIHADPGPSNE